MNYLISLVLLTVALVMQAIALKHLDNTLADVRKQVDGLDSRIVVLDTASKKNAREIHKVKTFVYRQSTMMEVADDAEA